MQRGGAPTFGRMGSIFDGDLMRQDVIEVEIKSGRGTKLATVGGSGETALEMEK